MKKFTKIFLFAILANIFLSNLAFAIRDFTVSVSPTTPGSAATYTFTFTIDDEHFTDGTGGNDHIDFDFYFPSGTGIPAASTVSEPSYVIINGVALNANSPTNDAIVFQPNSANLPPNGVGSAQRVRVRVADTINGSGSFSAGATVTIQITSASGITNPSTAGVYEIYMSCQDLDDDTWNGEADGTADNSEPYNSAAVTVAGDIQYYFATPQHYTITSSTSIGSITVTPTNTTVNNPSAYTVQFDVGSISGSGSYSGGRTRAYQLWSRFFETPGVGTNTSGNINRSFELANLDGRSINGNWSLKVLDLEATNTGTLNSWNITFPLTGGSNYTGSASPSTAITDNSTTGITSTITVSGQTGTINGNVSVTVNITHTRNRDLQVYLLAPGGDYFDITFTNDASTTTVPSNIAVSQCSVKVAAGSFINPQSIVTTPGSDKIRVYPATSQTISALQTVQVKFTQSAGIINPTSNGTNNRVTIASNLETSAGTSSAYTINNASTITTPNIVLGSSNEAGAANQYTISFNVGNSGALTGGSGKVYLTFPNNTGVPSSIDVGNITVNGTSASAITSTPSTRDIEITVPNNILNNAVCDIIISAAAGVKNPTTAGTYTLTARTSSETTPITSNSYTIAASTVTSADVNLSPVTASTASNYTVDFRAGSAGTLTAGSSTITIAFPSGTTISSLASSDIRVNSTLVSSTPTVSGTDVTFVSPVSVDANGLLSVEFINKKITNPVAGTYTLNVNTSVETTPVTSNTYTVSSSTTISTPSVKLGNYTSSTTTIDSIIFNVGTSGALFGSDLDIRFSADYIQIEFPSGTTVPSTIATTNITIQSPDAVTAAQTMNPNIVDVSGQVVTMYLPDPTTAGANNRDGTPEVPGNGDNLLGVHFPSSTTGWVTGAAGTIRKSTDGGEGFKEDASGITTQLNAIHFTDVNTGVAVGVVGAAEVIRRTINGGSTWSGITSANIPSITLNDIFFTNSTQLWTVGNASGGTEQVYRSADQGSTWSTNLGPTDAGTVNLRGVYFVDTNTGWVVGVRTVAGGNHIFKTTNGTATPPTWTGQTSAVATTVQLNKIFAIDANNAWIASNASGTTEVIQRTTDGGTSWNNVAPALAGTINFNDVHFVDANTGWAVGTTGTILKSVNGGANWVSQTSGTTQLLNGVYFQDSNTGWVVGNGGVVLKTTDGGSNWVNKAKGGLVRVIFAAAAGIVNPSTAKSTYKARVSTNTEVTKIQSNRYTIISNTPLDGTAITVTPANTNTTASYNIKFTTGSNGALQAGFDTIYVQFPSGTTVPSSIPTSSVKVNGITIGDAPAVSSRMVKIVSPVDVATSTLVNVDFSTSAGIVNPSTASTYRLDSLDTNIQPFTEASGSRPTYTISAPTNITSANVTPDPTTVSATASYTLAFTMGSAGFSGTGTFTITFPNDTQIPSSIATSNVTVKEAGVNQTINSVTTAPASRQVSIVVGENITANTQIQIIIVSAAGIKNPSTGSNSYTLEVSATSNGSATSNVYTITNTSLSAANVTPSPTTTSASAQYTVQFSVGSAGALTSGSSTITITFPSNTTVPSTMSASNVTVNSTMLSSAPTTNPTNRTVTFTTPVNVSNSGSVTVVFNSSAGLVNPTTAGSTYMLQVNTSIETTPVASNAYSITTSTQVSQATVTLSNAQRNAGSSAGVTYTVAFRVGTTGLANGGTITITFPTGTTVNTGTGLWATTDVTIENVTDATGAVASGGVTVNGTNRTVQVTEALVPTIDANDSLIVRLNVTPDANAIINPSTSGSSYTLQVQTSSEPTDVASKKYTITSLSSEQVSSATVTVDPNYSNQSADYTVAFNTNSTSGALAVGDTIFVDFDDANAQLTSVPSSISNTSITVNGTTCTVSPRIYSRKVAVVTPVAISAGGLVTVVFTSSAGVVNANETASDATHYVKVNTNINTTVVNSGTFTIAPSSSVTPATVTPSPATVNTIAQYTIEFTQGSTAWASGGTFTITFPDNTQIPASISTSDVTVTEVGVGNETISTVTTTPASRQVAIATSTATAASAQIRIVISSAGGIKNPTNSGNGYTLTVASTSNGSAISNTYTINQSTVTAANVTPNPSTTSSTSQYTINFNVGAGGALTAGSHTITVQFPSGTTVPATVDPATVKVNSTILSVAPTINTGTREVTMTTPVSISNSGSVSVVFEIGAGIANPSTTGSTYQVNVKTSVETSYIASNTYAITSASALTGGKVTITNPARTSATNYTLGFRRGSGVSDLTTANSIILTFPTGTSFTGLVVGDITITDGNESATADALTPSGTQLTIGIPAITIPASDTITVAFSNNRINNPSTTGSNYTISIDTDHPSENPVSSKKYTITSGSGVTVGTITPSPNTSSTAASYTIPLTTSANGAFNSGDSIVVIFPSGTTVPSSMVASNITVGGTACTVSPTISQASRRVAVVSPAAVGNSSSVNLVFNSSAGLVNPTAGTTYQISMLTTIDATSANSANYTIQNSANVTPATVTPSPTTVNTTSQYTISFTDGDDGVDIADDITIIFPSNTSVPASIATSSVTLNGSSANVTSVTTTPASRRVDVRSAINITPSTSITIVFSSSAGIVNPSSAGTSYQLTVRTTDRPTDVSSNTYSITQSTVSAANVTVNPNTTNSIGEYTVAFNVGAGGALTSGSSTITVVFPGGTILPSSIATGSISVNGTDLSVAPTVTVATRTVTLTTPVGVSNNGSVSVVFKTSANVQNPNTSGNYTLTVRTSEETTDVASNTYNIAAGNQVTQASVSLSEKQRTQQAIYTLRLKVGTTSPNLQTSSTITITFPTGTTIGGGWAASDVSVSKSSGSNNSPNSAPSVSGQELTIDVPDAIAPFSASDSLIIKVNLNANKLSNPSSSGSNYTVNVRTSAENTDVTSLRYTVTSLSSEQVSSATVTPSPNTSSSAAAYTIAFNTNATSGALLVGDSIIVVFPSGTTVPSSITASNVSVNGTACTTAPTISQASRRIAVVTPVAVGAGGSISLVFNSSAGLVNPTAGTTYQVTASTNINTTGVNSSNYTIQNSSNVTPATVTPSPTTVNTTAQYTISFTNGDIDITTAQDSITIIFPNDTNVPSSIANTSVTVNSVNPTEVITNPSLRRAQIRHSSTISASAAITVVFNASAGIKNPTTSGTAYQLQVHTTDRPTNVSSNTYTITQSTITSATVTPSPTTANSTAQYTIAFSVGAGGALTGGSSTITVVFPSGTIIPVSISPSSISVNSNAVTVSPTVNQGTRTVTFTTPVGVANNGSVSVVFATSANIQNPSTAGTNYTLDVYTSVETQSVTSSTYSITSAGQVSQVAVRSISNAQRTATNGVYTISFDRGNAGTLSVGDTIIIVLPAGTGVTNGAWTSGDARVKINAGSFTDAGARGYSSTRTVKVATPTVANANDSITVELNVANARITNPTNASSNYTLTVETKIDVGAVTSSRYTITSLTSEQVTAATVTPSPNYSNTSAAYTIAFNTHATQGAIVAGDSIVVIFPSGTTIPSSMTASTIEINGTACTAAPKISVSLRRVAVVTPVAVGSGGSVSLVFTSSAGLVNPGAGTTYTVTVSTTVNTQAQTSNNYTIQDSPNVTPATVTLANATVNTTTSYTLDFTLGSAAMSSGNTFTITFPSNTTVPNGTISTANVTVKENTVNQTLTSVSGNSSTRVITITIGEAIAASATIQIIFASAIGIVNPTTSGSTYQVNVAATGNGNTNSNTYTINASTVTSASVTVSPTVKDVLAQYTVAFNVGAMGALSPGNTITITFPTGTVIGSAVSGTPGNTTVNSTSATTVSVASQAVTVTVPSGVNVANNGSVSVIFANASNMITNPSTAQSYNLQVRTNVETTDIASNSYLITNSTTVTQPRVISVSPRTSGSQAVYTIGFRVGSNGSLSGSGSITITFPTGTTLTSGDWGAVNHVSVEKNSGGAQSPDSNPNATGQALTVDVPNAIAPVANNDSLTVRVNLNTNRLTNPSTAGSNKTLTARTSTETTDIASGTYLITSSTSQTSAATVSASPDTGGSTAAYTITFNTGSNGALTSGDTIVVNFPSNTTVPASISASNVQVNSTTCTVAPVTSVANRRVSVISPVAVSASASVSLVILRAAGIQNPSSYLEGGYTLTARTSVEPTLTTSNSYIIKNSDGSVNVYLSEFVAVEGKRFVTLNWKTETELNNYEWWVQRSEEGKSGSYVTIKKIKGQGNTSQATNYMYKDFGVKSGKTYYYKLVDVDYNGVIFYHGDKIRSAKVLVPEKFNLSQNYPNPFNPTTKIEYDLPVSAGVRIEIFDILGRRVKTLIDERKETGFYTTMWDGRNNYGKEVASGVYLYRIIVVETNRSSSVHKKLFTQVKKMLILK